MIKDPFVLEFLDLREHPDLHERDVEQAIIDRLETSLLELGKGFSFVGRQVRLTVEGDHFYVDLVFYNRRCFVLIDLKLGKLTHQDLGQMIHVYELLRPHAARARGSQDGGHRPVLREERCDGAYHAPRGGDQIVAATYKRYLPSEAELAAELTRERDAAERMLRLRARAMRPRTVHLPPQRSSQWPLAGSISIEWWPQVGALFLVAFGWLASSLKTSDALYRYG